MQAAVVPPIHQMALLLPLSSFSVAGKDTSISELVRISFLAQLFCRAKAKDRNFDFGRKLAIDIFGTFKTSFIMCISI